MSGRLLYLDDQPTIKKLLEDKDNCIKYRIPETNNLDFFNVDRASAGLLRP